MSAQNKQMSIVRMIVALGIITAVAAVVLALTYQVTAEPIAQAAMAQENEAIEAVVPEFNNNPVAEADTITLPGESRPLVLYPAMVDGKLTGMAVQTYTDNGFSGLFTLMVGFDAEGTVIDYRILSHAETPGLGAKMDTWFRDTVGHRSIIGLNPATTHFFVVKDPQGQIDGITAATISSRAFLEAVRRASEAFKQYLTAHPNLQKAI